MSIRGGRSPREPEMPIWRASDGRGAPLTSKNIAMSLDLAGEPFPAGDIDLAGRDW